MFTIIHTYNPETESFCRIIQLGLQKVLKQPDYTFTEEWKNNDDEDIPYASIQVSPSLKEQFHQAFPQVPMDEWESLVDAINDAHDSISMEEVWTAFLDIYYEYELAD